MNFVKACERGDLDQAITLYTIKLYTGSLLDVAFAYTCNNGHTAVAKWLSTKKSFDYDKTLLITCKQDHVELCQWLSTLVDQNVREKAFRSCCECRRTKMAKVLYALTYKSAADIPTAVFELSTNHEETMRWLYSIRPLFLSETIKTVIINYNLLGISPETQTLFFHIRFNWPFPKIETIDESVIHSLVHYNMIDHLLKLRDQFPYIVFDVVNDHIENFAIRRFGSKNARNVSSCYI